MGPASIDGRLLLRGTTLLTVGGGLSKIAGVVTMVLAARVLSPEAFGAYTFALGFGALMLVFADLGIDVITTRELAAGTRPDGDVLGTALVMKAVAVGLVVVGGGACLFTFTPALRPAAALAGVMVLSAIPGTLALALSGRVQMAAVAGWRLAGALVALTASLVVLAVDPSVLGLVLAQLSGALVSSTALARAARRRFPYDLRVDKVLLRHLARQTAPLALILGASWIAHRVDLMLLARLASPVEIGHYAAAVKMLELLNLVVAAVAAVSLPAFAVARDPLGRLAVTLRCCALILLPLAALASLGSGALLAAVYGSRFEQAGAALAVLVAAHCFAVVQLFWHQLLIARERISALALLAVSGAVLNIVLNVVLIPRHGGLGAAWASLVAYSVPILAAPLVPQLRPLAALTLRATWRPLVATALLGVAVASPLHAGVVVALVPVALLVTRSLTREDVQALTTLLRTRTAVG